MSLWNCDGLNKAFDCDGPEFIEIEHGGMTRKERDKTRNAATDARKRDAKSAMRAEFIKKHGRKPNKKEAIQMTAKAKAAAKALK